MFKEETSQPLMPLAEERGESPAPVTSGAPQPTFSEHEPRWLAWLDVARALGFWIISVVLLGVIPILFALPYMIYRVSELGMAALGPEAIKSDTMLIFFSVVGIIPTHLLTIYLAWLVVSEGGIRPFWKTLRWEWPVGKTPRYTVLVSVGLAIGLYALAWGITTIYKGEKTELDLLIESSIYTRVATAVIAFATAPLAEEIIYRGVIYSAIEKAGGTGLAITIVSLLFAGVHVYQYRNNLAVISVITLLSITLTVSRAVTGKLLPAFIIHLVFNGVQSVLIVLSIFIDKPLVK